MNLADIKELLHRLQERATKSDGIILSIGVAAFIAGILLDVFILRLICLFIVVGSAVLVVAAIRAKQGENAEETQGASPQPHSQSQYERMKKLVFDDFQAHTEGHVTFEETLDEIPLPPMPHLEQDFSEPSLAQVHPGAPGEVRPPVNPREYVVSDFFDLDSVIFKGDTEPRTEFDFLLDKVLCLIKEVTFAHTVAFFWANRDKEQLVLEAKVTDSASFLTGRRFSFGHDLLSKVALTGKPELVTDVNESSEHELFRYYDIPASIRSFVGVPVFFANKSQTTSVDQPVAVIAIDSQIEGQFGAETVVLLGQYTKLVSALIKSYTDKYDLLLHAELLRSIRRMQERIRNNFSLATITQALADEASKLLNWDFLSIVLYDETKRTWVAKRVMNRIHEGYLVAEQAIDFPKSVVAETIRRNAHRMIDDLEAVSMPRYFSEERPAGTGSFLSIPMSSLNKCYGAVNLESRDKFNFSRQDIEMLYRLAENAASALEIFYMQEVINEYVIIDDVTGVYSKKFFSQKLEEELQRADDNGSELSMLFITLDKVADVVARFGQGGLERVMLTLAKAIRGSVRTYDIVGRYDNNRFGVLLINTAANEAYLWAEKIRKSVASHVISLEEKSFSITISTGVCGALEGMKKEELVGNTTAVVNRAAESGGNAVRVF